MASDSVYSSRGSIGSQKNSPLKNLQKIQTFFGTMNGSAATSSTVTEPAPVRLVLKKKKKVVWAEGTVDNENLNKKSSKKCCIYHKPRVFGESSSDESSCCSVDEGECDHH
jgi:hypothetical protein